MKFRQVGGIQSLISENFVNTKVFLGNKSSLLIGQFVQHPGGHCGGVSPQEVLGCLLHLPVVAVALGPVAPDTVHPGDLVQVGLGEVLGGSGVRDEEGVVSISSRMLLRLIISNILHLYCMRMFLRLKSQVS